MNGQDVSRETDAPELDVSETFAALRSKISESGGAMGTGLAFGPFRIDVPGRQLSRGKDLITLAPKTLDLLVYLAEHAGEVITRDQIFAALWPDTYVDDHALSVQIGELRKALGDDARNPQYIETRHRRGYCFKAEVKTVSEPRSVASKREMDLHTGVVSPGLHALAARPGYGPIDTELAAPETHYARSGDVNIAYQVIGSGPIDLVFVMGWVSHIEYFWTEPRLAHFLRRLASFSRLILFDKRGTGLSDRVPVESLPTIEQRMSDLRIVMNAVGSKRAAICGISEGGCMSAVFAATYPEQTQALILIGTYAKRIWAPDYPWAPTKEERALFMQEILDHWGSPVGLEARAPSLANDPQFRHWWATYLRMCASPGAALALTQMNTEVDIRHVLPLVGIPTLVIHRAGDLCIKVEEGRYVASQIPGARFIELPGEDHLPFVGDQDEVLDQVEQFLAQVQSIEPEHVLATVIVAEFEPAAETAQPRHLTSEIQAQINRFRATWNEQSGVRVSAAFDGPARAVEFARALQDQAPHLGFSIRAGLHTGQCVSTKGSMQGAAFEIAAEVCGRAALGEVLVSGTVRDLMAGSGILLEPSGRLEMDSRGEWQLLKVHRPRRQATEAG